MPYLPKGFEYPKTPDGKYLFLLAQINFSEVPPLDGFPDRGILQFYIGDDSLYGFGSEQLPECSQVLYFHEPDLSLENPIINYDFLPEPEYFPVYGCYGLQFTKKYRPISIADYQCSQLLGEDCYELLTNNYRIEEQYLQISRPFGHKISGYPDFAQGDPRCGNNPDSDTEQNILLLQMDSSDDDAVHILWGDGGVCNFFISKSELINLDFSDVWYNWDCV